MTKKDAFQQGSAVDTSKRFKTWWIHTPVDTRHYGAGDDQSLLGMRFFESAADQPKQLLPSFFFTYRRLFHFLTNRWQIKKELREYQTTNSFHGNTAMSAISLCTNQGSNQAHQQKQLAITKSWTKVSEHQKRDKVTSVVAHVRLLRGT
jgi:hypothetical protein